MLAALALTCGSGCASRPPVETSTPTPEVATPVEEARATAEPPWPWPIAVRQPDGSFRVAYVYPDFTRTDGSELPAERRAPDPVVGDRADAHEVWCYNSYYSDPIHEQEILLVVEAGRDIIPDLIPLLRDGRWSKKLYYWPYSSWSGFGLCNFCKAPPVAWWACYLIEAVLRNEPYFTRSGRLAGLLAGDYSDAPRPDALDAAIAAYEEWFARCYDPTTRQWLCPEDDLPVVDWDYDAYPGLADWSWPDAEESLP